MAVRSIVFSAVSGDVHPAAYVVRYTVPAGRTAIVHAWSLSNRAGGSQLAIVSVRRQGQLGLLRIVGALGGTSTMSGQGERVVLGPGDTLESYLYPTSGAGGAFSFYASGSLLDGVAS